MTKKNQRQSDIKEVNEVLEHVRSQVNWINRNLEATEDWLKEQETFYRATDYRGS